MKHINHQDRKSFKQWGQRWPIIPVLTKKAPLPRHRTKHSPGPARFGEKMIPYAPSSIITQPGQSVNVMDTRDSNKQPLYFWRDGVRRSNPKPYNGKAGRRRHLKARKPFHKVQP